MNSPLGKQHSVVWASGRVACTAQAAVEGNVVGLFDVVTAESARRRGYATLACASLLSWAWQHGAQIAYLQVKADNTPAIASYRRFGFATVYTYHYRGRPGECE
jgi:GNAT superfamily N-acetyltransferase